MFPVAPQIDAAGDPAGPPPLKVMSNLLVGVFFLAWDLNFRHQTGLEPKDRCGKLDDTQWRT